MNAEQIIYGAMTGLPDSFFNRAQARHIATALRAAGIDLNHTYEEAPLSDFAHFFRDGKLTGIKATVELMPESGSTLCPSHVYVRRPLNKDDE